MKRLFLSLVILACVSCGSPNKVSLEAIKANWDALKPYTITGIQATPDLEQFAKDELIHECDRLSAVIEEELSYAR